jgi:hypothetical protein
MGNQSSKLPRGEFSNTEDYHLQFKNSQPEKEFGQTVDVYLRKAFTGDPPLKYERHYTTSGGYVFVCRPGLESGCNQSNKLDRYASA